MRLMIIGVIAFGLAALAMIIADGRFPKAMGVASWWGGDVRQVRFSSDIWVPKQSRSKIIIPIAQEQWKAMTGFPSYASFDFPLPRHTPIEDGRFVLEFALQLPSEGGGALRVMINNDKRADFVFDPRQKKYRLVIDLNDVDLKSRRLSVALSADGYGAGGECPDDRARVSVIEISPKTRIELTLSKPIEHPADAALLAGNPIRLAPPKGLTQRQRERLFALAHRLKQEGLSVSFVDEKEAAGRITLVVDPKVKKPRYDRKTKKIIVAGPRDANLLFSNLIRKERNALEDGLKRVSVDYLDAPLHVRQFRHEVKWRLNFTLKDMPGGKAPTQFDLNLFRSIAGENTSSLVSVTFNDGILYAAPLGDALNPLKKELRLSANDVKLENSIEISLIANEDRIGVCNPGRDGFAQLMKSSTLTRLRKLNDARPEVLPSQLHAAGLLHIHAPYELTPSDFRESLSMLSRITPASLKLTGSDVNKSHHTPQATIIPLKKFRNDIEKYLAQQEATDDLKKNNRKQLSSWVIIDATAIDHKNPAEQFALLTRSTANQIAANNTRGIAVILQVPTPEEENAS